MTGSQKFSSYPVSNPCPFGQASALLLCSKDNTDLLSFDKLLHYYYHCCKSLAYSNYGESCSCYLISRLIYNLEPQTRSNQFAEGKWCSGRQICSAGAEILWSHAGAWSARNAYPLLSTWFENGGMRTTLHHTFLVPKASWH